MTTFESIQSGQTGFASGWLRMAVAFISRLTSAISHRRSIERLRHFDDHSLNDLGLTRADVEIALGVPFYRDPSHRLVDRIELRDPARRASRGWRY